MAAREGPWSVKIQGSPVTSRPLGKEAGSGVRQSSLCHLLLVHSGKLLASQDHWEQGMRQMEPTPSQAWRTINYHHHPAHHSAVSGGRRRRRPRTTTPGPTGPTPGLFLAHQHVPGGSCRPVPGPLCKLLASLGLFLTCNTATKILRWAKKFAGVFP